MFQFFKKEKVDAKHIQLVSLHIPKTAGTSFRNTLKKAYGEHEVVRLDIDPLKDTLKIEQAPYKKNKLKKKWSVIHGHFSPENLDKKMLLPEQVPFITWLRDPVERVISNFYYLEKRLKEELDEEGKGLNILSKMQRSLTEYAQDEINRNRISKFLSGKPIESFLFVGIVEHYAEDLNRLAQLLEWNSYEVLKQNVTGSKRDVSPEIREKIKSLNSEDVRIYEQALKMRKQFNAAL